MSASAFLPAYPTSRAVRHGAWLRQLAQHLPALAARYELPITEVLALQALDAAYRAWLRRHVTGPAVAEAEGGILLTQARPLLERLCRHPAYCGADARRLHLAGAPWPLPPPPPMLDSPPVALRPLSAVGGTAPMPTPRLSALLYPGRQVVLLWRRRRGTCFELQVNRSGRYWRNLTGAGGQPLLRFLDAVPARLQQPAVWHYRGRYVGPDGQPGPWSAVLEVTVAPPDANAAPAPPISLPLAA